MQFRFSNLCLGLLVLTFAIACSRQTALTTIDDSDIERTFEELALDTPPEKLYQVFNDFCLHYFGAKTDPIYDSLGKFLHVVEKGHWTYISERSAAVAWETNLPAKSYVEYGLTPQYGLKTQESERFFFLHTHYLKNLKPQTLYYYKVVSFDEKGRRTESPERNFTTFKADQVVYLPGDGQPPYVLDKPNTLYLVSEDIVAPGTAFEIQADGITLDLGGHTITHANELVSELDYKDLHKSGVGVRSINKDKITGLKILNGILQQGRALNNQDYLAGENMLKPDPERRKILDHNNNRGFSNIEITAVLDVEIAGVTAIYHLPQVWGMRFDQPAGSYNIHHNVFLDKGTQMFNRHGAGGARSLGFSNRGEEEAGGNDFQVHHNLVKRTRQNALNVAQKIYNNEIYVDSWVVNSFAIQPAREKAEVLNNKIFLTGYYSCGILWASRDLLVRNNFIHMESVKTMIDPPEKGRRLIETWGEQDVLAAMRVTNYGKGGTARENLLYENNIIFGRCRKGTEMRGAEFFSDYSNKNFVFKNSTVKILVADSTSAKAACVDTQGAFNDRSTHLPIYYKNSILASNICNIRFGDAYGQGSNHRFINCQLQRTDERNPNYHTFIFDGGSSVFNHVLLDCDFQTGTHYEDVYWENTGSHSNYTVQWTFTLETNPGAAITIKDQSGSVVVADNAGANGVIAVPLPQCTIRPLEWDPAAEPIPVMKKSQHQKQMFSPYSVTVSLNGKEKTQIVDVENKTAISLFLE